MSLTNYTTLIQAEQLAPKLGRANWVTIDCSFSLADHEFGRTNYFSKHIPGAQYAHLDEDLAAVVSNSSGRHPLPDVTSFVKRLRSWGINKQSQVVVYDHAVGSIAVRLWWMMKWLGHTNVALLDGGLARWISLNLPLEKETRPVQYGDFLAQPNDQAWVDVTALIELMQHGECILVDARGAERYHGRHEPIDKVAGHVAGAINLPYDGNLDPSGCFIPPAQLKQRFTPLIQAHSSQQIIHMCGSGVTACHNLLALEIVGVFGTRLYPGSWSEWIVDPRRAVVNDMVKLRNRNF